MTLTIELSSAEQARLTEAARLEGLAPPEFVRRVLSEHLPPTAERASAGESLPSGVPVSRQVTEYCQREGLVEDLQVVIRLLKGCLPVAGEITGEVRRDHESDDE